MKERYKNSKQQGDAGLGVAIGWFAVNGYTVCIPLTDSQDYDLVVDFGGLKKVQVRTTYLQLARGAFSLNLRVCGGNRTGIGTVKKFDPMKIDFIFGVTSSGQKYLIPASEISAKSALLLGRKCDKYMVY